MSSVAVLLSTFNGEKYIKTQLKSLLEQTYHDFDVYINDDYSCDGTVEIIRKFIDENQLTNWHVSANKENVGWKKNFANMMFCSNAEIIFFCDQDDYWMPNKITEMVDAMEKNKHVSVLVCKYVFFQDDCEIEKRKASLLNLSYSIKKVQCKNFMRTDYPGCTYCVRKEFISTVTCLWNPSLPHDSFLWKCSFLLDSLYIIEKPLILWRQHNDSAMGGAFRHSSYEERKKYVTEYKDYLNYLCNSELLKKRLSKEKNKMLHKYLRWIDCRYKLLIERQYRYLFRLFFMIPLYPTFMNFLGDVRYVIKFK